jgi:hypothetical protein
MGEGINDFGKKVWKGFKSLAVGLAIFGAGLYAGDYLLSNTVAGSELLHAGQGIIGDTHNAASAVLS